MSVAADVERAVGDVLARGPVDILVNSAGVSHIGTVEQTSAADFDRLFDVNVKGTYHCIKAVIGAMAARRSGVIVNLASVAASAGLANRFAYSMTKGAIVAMTYSVARDYVSSGIRCVSISPARIHTPFVDGYLAKTLPGPRGRDVRDALGDAADRPHGRRRARSRTCRCTSPRTRRPLPPAPTIRSTAGSCNCMGRSRDSHHEGHEGP